MKTLHALLAPLAVTCLSPLAAAQTVHVVDAGGGGGFFDIQPAVDVAATGDIVLVRSGTYTGFEVDGKGIVVAADAGATVAVDGAVMIENIALGDEVVLSGLRIFPASSSLVLSALAIRTSPGHVLAQDMDVEIPSSTVTFFGAMSVIEVGAATLVDSRIDGSSSFTGITASTVLCDDSSLFVHGTEILAQSGADGSIQGLHGQPGGVALEVRGGTALVVGCDLTGGRGGDGNTLGTPGNGGMGGPALRLSFSPDNTTSAVVYDSTLTGGPGGIGLPPATDGAMGVPTEANVGTLTTPAAFERRYGAEAVVRDGNPTALTFEGQPFDLVWHILAIDTNPLTVYLPDALGAIHPGGNPFLFRFRGLLNGLGQKTLNVSLTPTGLDYLPFYEQALMYNDTEGFVASNPRFVAFLSSSIP